MESALPLIARAMSLLKLVRLKATLTVVASVREDTENSEETLRIKRRGDRVIVTSPDSNQSLEFNGVAALLHWIASSFAIITIVQIESSNTHFPGEREITTLLYHPLLGPAHAANLSANRTAA